MNLNPHRSKKTTTCLFSFLILFYILFLSYTDRHPTTTRTGWSAFSLSSILIFLPLVIVALLVVVAVRTTIVAWITVLVLLAFAGKRRRVLVVEGRKITSDVAMYLLKVVVKERSLVAVASATIVSSVAMACLR